MYVLSIDIEYVLLIHKVPNEVKNQHAMSNNEILTRCNNPA